MSEDTNKLHETAMGRTCWSALILIVCSVFFPWAIIGRDPTIVAIAWTLLALLGLLIFYTGVVGSVIAWRSLKWPEVFAKVTVLGFDTRLHKGKHLYRPRIDYEFSVGGQDYSGATFDFASEYMSEAKAEKLRASVLSGEVVSVRYDPDDPSQNVIRPGPRFVHLLQIGFGLAGMIVGPLTLVGVIVWG